MIEKEPQLPDYRMANYPERLNWKLTQVLRNIIRQVNGLSAGYVSASDTAYTSAPTTGTWNQGDFVRNTQPSEAGSAGSKYVVAGWICSASGTPGTWLQCRYLTGN